MATFTDHFVRGSAQELDASANWTRIGTGRIAQIADGGGSNDYLTVGSSPTADGAYRITDDFPGDRFIEVDQRIETAGSAGFYAIRLVDANNFVGFRLFRTSGPTYTMQLHKRVSGSFTLLDSYTVGAGLGVLRLTMTGDSLQMSFNGTPGGSGATDNAHASSNAVGVVTRTSAVDVIDYFTVENAAVTRRFNPLLLAMR